MANTTLGCMWSLDSDASFHMTGNIYLFSDLEDKDLWQNIDFGDDERYSVTGIGTVTFQRNYVSPLRLADVLYVPGLRNNLVSVTVLEDCGYELMFRRKGVP